jgi:ketosteroid isomerase-like protein
MTEVAYFNYVVQDDRVVVEGFTHGTLADGTTWQATETLGGRFCNVFEIRGGKIQRLHVYLDPDYGDADTARYPWLTSH